MKDSVKLKLRILASAVSLLLTSAVPLNAGERFTLESARVAAERGNSTALYFLAKRYEKGEGVSQDSSKAAQFMRQAAQKGYALAQNDLGAYYAKGFGVGQDYAEAASWYLKAAEQGDPLAEFSMGMVYSRGRGVPKDMNESINWLRKAGQHKRPEALVELGDIYLRGREGVRADPWEARKWYLKAYAQGRIDAFNNVGYIYETGVPGRFPPNLKKALAYYRKAAQKGDARAQMNLGRMYQSGSGVGRNLVEAYKWFYLAELNGEPLAKHYLQDLGGENPLLKAVLSSDQIAEAIRRAGECQMSGQRKK